MWTSSQKTWRISESIHSNGIACDKNISVLGKLILYGRILHFHAGNISQTQRLKYKLWKKRALILRINKTIARFDYYFSREIGQWVKLEFEKVSKSARKGAKRNGERERERRREENSTFISHRVNRTVVFLLLILNSLWNREFLRRNREELERQPEIPNDARTVTANIANNNSRPRNWVWMRKCVICWIKFFLLSSQKLMQLLYNNVV